MYVTSFSSKFDGHTFISLKVISALQGKKKKGREKSKQNEIESQIHHRSGGIRASLATLKDMS